MKAFPAKKHLLKIQRDVYASLAEEASRLLGRQSDDIEEYDAQFARDFKRLSIDRLRPTTKRQLIEEIRESDLTLVGDYHTFAQAQRTALRLLRDAVHGGETWVFGVELVPSDRQDALDAFQAGRITVEEFHEKIRYDEEWGFPWKNYAPIFEWCAQHRVRMLALNRPKKLYGGGLLARDLWAAGLLTDAFAAARAEGTQLRAMVLYGELHLGSAHLPLQFAKTSRKFLKRALRTTVVHQNHDEIFWKVSARPSREDAPATAILRLKPHVYCAFSSPPWTKLQSLVSWLQGCPFDAPGTLADPDDDYVTEGDSPDGIDYLGLMKTSLKPISDFFGVVPPPLDMITAHTIRDADFIDGLEKDLRFSPAEFRVLKRHVLENERVYFPRSNLVYLGIPSPNAAAELAAIHLFRRRHGSVELLRTDGEGIARLLLEYAFGFLGSLILNPRRKCDLPADHRKRIAEIARLLRKPRAPRKTALRDELAAREQALRLIKSLTSRKSAPLDWPDGLPLFAGMLGTRYAGYWLGRICYQALLEERLPIARARELFLSKTPGTTFQDRVWELRALAVPTDSRGSKRDHL